MKKYRKIILSLITLILVGLSVLMYMRHLHIPSIHNFYTQYEGEESRGYIFINGVRLAYAYSYNTGIIGNPIYLPIHVIAIELGGLMGPADGYFSIFSGEPFSLYGQRVRILGLRGEIINAIGSNEFIINNKLVVLDYSIKEIDDSLHAPIHFFIDHFGVNDINVEDGNVYIYGDNIEWYPNYDGTIWYLDNTGRIQTRARSGRR